MMVRSLLEQYHKFRHSCALIHFCSWYVDTSNDLDRQALDSRRSTVVHTGKLPARVNMELLGLLQEAETAIFTPKVVYDGWKIIFTTCELPWGPTDSYKVI